MADKKIDPTQGWEAEAAWMQEVLGCRDGFAHYCPNCDNTLLHADDGVRLNTTALQAAYDAGRNSIDMMACCHDEVEKKCACYDAGHTAGRDWRQEEGIRLHRQGWAEGFEDGKAAGVAQERERCADVVLEAGVVDEDANLIALSKALRAPSVPEPRGEIRPDLHPGCSPGMPPHYHGSAPSAPSEGG